jgi:hypothetical protein
LKKAGTNVRDIGHNDCANRYIEVVMKFAKVATLLAVTALSTLSACSGIPRETDAQALQRYTSYAGDRVNEFRTFGAFNSWTPVDNHHVVIQTNVNEAYLVTVFEPCINLPFATRLGVTSRFPNSVQAGFDSLRVGRDRCRISEIRTLNYKQMRADLAAEKKARG